MLKWSFSINLEFDIIKGEGLQASIVLHSKVGMTPWVPLTHFIRQISEFPERTLGALIFDSIATTLVMC